MIKTNTHTHKITKLKQESREKRNDQQLSIESEPSEPHNFGLLSKSVDSKDKSPPKTDEKHHPTHITKTSTLDANERSTKDSPYISSYASKGKRKKSKEQSSKENLRKPIRKKVNRGEEAIDSVEESKYSKYSEVQRMNLTQNIKVKPNSQNNRKKIRKQNWNTITDEFFLDNILKFSRPNK